MVQCIHAPMLDETELLDGKWITCLHVMNGVAVEVWIFEHVAICRECALADGGSVQIMEVFHAVEATVLAKCLAKVPIIKGRQFLEQRGVVGGIHAN